MVAGAAFGKFHNHVPFPLIDERLCLVPDMTRDVPSRFLSFPAGVVELVIDGECTDLVVHDWCTVLRDPPG